MYDLFRSLDGTQPLLRVADLVADAREVAAVNARQHPQREHVPPLAGIVHDGTAALLQRDEDDAAGLHGELGERGAPRGLHVLVGMRGPHVLEPDDGVRRERAQAVSREQHLLLEGQDELRLVAAVGHRRSADAVAALRGDRTEDLVALLRALSGVDTISSVCSAQRRSSAAARGTVDASYVSGVIVSNGMVTP